MQLREWSKEHYLLEATRRNELASALSVPVAVLSAVLGVQGVIANDVHVPLEGVNKLLIALLILGALCAALCTYFLIRSLYGLAYAFVPTALALDKYKRGLLAYYLATGSTPADAETQADGEALAYLYGEYAKNADRNSTNNDIKSAFIHKANSALIGAIILTATAGVFYVHSSVASPKPIPRVEVVSHPAVLASPEAASSSPPPPAAPAKPEPPPSRVIREHRNPPPPPRPASG